METDLKPLKWKEPKRWRRVKWKPFRSLLGLKKKLRKAAPIIAGIFFAVLSSSSFEPTIVEALLFIPATVLALLLVDRAMFMLSQAEVEFGQNGFSRKCGMLLEEWKYEDVTDHWSERKTHDGQIVDILIFKDKKDRLHEITLSTDIRPDDIRRALIRRLSDGSTGHSDEKRITIIR